MLPSVCSVLMLVGSPPLGSHPLETTPVAEYGRLRVHAGRVCDAEKRPASLAGVSLFWSQWEGEFYNRDCVRWLVKDWRISVIRVPVGVAPDGYLMHPVRELRKVEAVIDAAVKAGIYVIVDWHDHHAERHLAQSKKFFSVIAQKYGKHPNLIYEIYNEPLEVSWSGTVKPYAVEVLREIRKYDSKNLVVVGTPRWSQRVDLVAADRIKDPNVAYALHFYSATHKKEVREQAQRALNSSVPVFVTEWGSVLANGKGTPDYKSTAEWLEFLEKNKLSHCVWSVCDKAEGSAALVPRATPSGNWPDSQLTPSGRFSRNLIRDWPRR